MSPPHPLVLPAMLGINPTQVSSPPSYEDSIDIEKALRLFPLPPTAARSDASHHSISSTAPVVVLPQVRITQATSSTCRPSRLVRALRHFRYSIFTVYRRLFTLVFVLNGIGTLVLVQQHSYRFREAFSLGTLAALASSNFLLAILVRQDFLVNLLFRTAWLVPWYVPLRIRRLAARVYCYGGVHSGAAMAGTIWWIVFIISMSWTFARDGLDIFSVLILTWILLLLLLTILLLALPSLRARYHDTFEITHRFLGWLSILLFWAQLLLLSHHKSTFSATERPFSSLLLHDPTFWNLTLITAMLIYPWLRLRRWTFTAHTLSSHALRLSFPHPIHKFSCLSISHSPLREWHPFATFPSLTPSHPGASMVISAAGDWTRSLIHTAQQQTSSQLGALQHQTGREKGTEGDVQLRFWVKSHPKAGVLSLFCLFPRVIILTTGSGIGPALSSLLDRPAGQFVRLIWSARAPVHTYGEKMLELVQQADPEALVIDTSVEGRPDLLGVAARMYTVLRAEAVFVLSNESVTRMVVGGLEKRGVPAFGPIWDS